MTESSFLIRNQLQIGMANCTESTERMKKLSISESNGHVRKPSKKSSSAASSGATGDDPLFHASELDLLMDIQEGRKALAMVLDNKQDDAINVVIRRSDNSLYFGLAEMGLGLLNALLTLDDKLIAQANEVARNCAIYINKRRRKRTFVDANFFNLGQKRHYDDWTEEEIQAELCYAECQGLRAIATFIKDRDMFTFMKTGARFRVSYQTYKECAEILESRKWKNEILRNEFKAGVSLGLGCFNIILSTFPKRYLKFLEFVGFSGNREIGMKRLEDGNQLEESIRGPLCTLVMGVYHLTYCSVLTKGCDRLNYITKMIHKWAEKYPETYAIQLGTARMAMVCGDIAKAKEWYEKSMQTNVRFKKAHHLAFWELAFCNIIQGNYREGASFMLKMFEDSTWSPATYLYVRCCCLLMCDDITLEEKEEVGRKLKEINKLKRVFSGKTNPMEDFCALKAELYVTQGDWLLLPIFELYYEMNYLHYLNQNPEIVNRLLSQLEGAIAKLKERGDWKYYLDNLCQATFLKGVCHRHLKQYEVAEACFKKVLENQKNLRFIKNSPSYSYMELGFMAMDLNDNQKALEYLRHAKSAKKEKTILAEFRIHRALDEIETGVKS